MNAKIILNNNFIESQNNNRNEVYSIFNNELLGSVENASVNQVNEAVSIASNAFNSWKYSNISDRISILKKISNALKNKIDLISNLLSNEIGKTIDEAKSEVLRSIEYLDLTIDSIKYIKGDIYYGDIFSKYSRNKKNGYYTRVPLGVVLAISPFNYPINLSITKIAPALITGNTVVFKPAYNGSLSAFEFYKTFIDEGLPSGVLNYITGKSSEIGDALLTNESISIIAFTGSTNVGNHIKNISNGKILLLELGGKDNAIVTSNADLDLASSEIVSGAFSYSGQRCTAQKLVLVYESVAEGLINNILEKTKDLSLNPMIDSNSCDYIIELFNDAKEKGAKIELNLERNNNILTPSIVSNVNENMRIFHEEQFGPLLPICLVKDERDALNKALKSKYGLQASVYTNNIEEAYRISDKLEVGTVQINGKGDRGPDNFPFGGVKGSGMNIQGLVQSMELMTRGKLIVLNLHNQ